LIARMQMGVGVGAWLPLGLWLVYESPLISIRLFRENHATNNENLCLLIHTYCKEWMRDIQLPLALWNHPTVDKNKNWNIIWLGIWPNIQNWPKHLSSLVILSSTCTLNRLKFQALQASLTFHKLRKYSIFQSLNSLI
jgi:hypothetical protein